MEAEKNQNLEVKTEIDEQSTAKMTIEVAEKLNQAISDTQNSINDEKVHVIQLQKVDEQGANQSSTKQTISLINCHCSCHHENVKDEIRYELIKEEPIEAEVVKEDSTQTLTTESKVVEPIPSVISEKQSQVTQISQVSQVTQSSVAESIKEVSIKESAATTKTDSDLLTLDKLNHGKLCSKCGKLKIDWLYIAKEKEKISKTGETLSKIEDLASLQTEKSIETVKSENITASMHGQTSIESAITTKSSDEYASIKTVSDSDVEESFKTAQFVCHNECKLHCPKKSEDEQSIEKQPLLTASDTLSQTVHSIESIASKLVTKEETEPKKSVQIVEEVEKVEKKKKKKDIYADLPKIPPKVILSLADIDAENKKHDLQEKSTQSPSVHTTQVIEETIETETIVEDTRFSKISRSFEFQSIQ
ncbi:hypothetical protein PVAND_000798 [Polypedilum vanderplanki]|uniref:Uncharacterized protein n=1 Tax=Polypedilum vanderplanki TaxID=319348 RepID=A0A9J6BLN1_POLVA|nr:hypothetical protein PVAND_000798 [Polypedilum vanderplanki]